MAAVSFLQTKGEMNGLKYLLVPLLIVWLSPTAIAEEQAAGSGVPDETIQDGDLLGRSTPRGAMTGFLLAVDEGDDEKAAKYLDLRNLPKSMSVYTPEQLATV